MTLIREGQNFTATEIGPLSELDQVTSNFVPGKHFLKEILNLTGMEVSVNKMPAGKESPFLHSHKQNEELFIFIKGSGQMQVDGEVFDVREGSMIRVAVDGSRAIRSSETEDLYYICIQATENSMTQWTRTDGIKLEDPVVWPE